METPAIGTAEAWYAGCCCSWYDNVNASWRRGMSHREGADTQVNFLCPLHGTWRLDRPPISGHPTEATDPPLEGPPPFAADPRRS